MKMLLYKQFRLLCHPMAPVFCLFGAMVLIPNYPYSVTFFYVTLGLFFSFLNMREQKDLYYSALLPIRKRDSVKASLLFAAAIELLSLAVTALFCLLSCKLQPGKDNAVGLDANVMLLAVGFMLYAVFNIVFFPSLYRTGYRVGGAFLKANVAMWPIILAVEAAVHIPALSWLDDTDGAANLRQMPLLLAGAALYIGLTVWAYGCAAKRYEKVDL